MTSEFAPLDEIYEVMKSFQRPWFICGGWAIDLALGRKTREHKDIDIGIFRADQLALQKYLTGWDFYKVLPNEVRDIVEWEREEFLKPPIHETRVKKGNKEIEFLLNDANSASWMYRRNNQVWYPKENLIHYKGKLPYWSPEVSLLYKAKAPRPHDEKDFNAIVGELSVDAKTWLYDAIQKTHPGHQWLKGLEL